MTRGVWLVKVVIFDFDGVLADTEEQMLSFSEIACAELGYPCQPTRADLEAAQPMSFANLGRQFGLPEELIPVYVQRSLELFCNDAAPLKIFPGIAEVVARISRSARVGIISGNTSDTIKKFLANYHLDQYVQSIYGVDTPGSKPEKIHRMVDRFGLSDGTIFIGDTTSDVQAAREAAITSVAVSWGHHNRQTLVGARPDYLVDSPEELLSILVEVIK